MKSVLIVEDEKAIRAGLRAMIENSPVAVENVIESRNGMEAMDILKKQAVDVMFTDIRMPKMGGIELVGRASELPSPPIIIVISGFSEFDYAVNVLRYGVRDYLLKPVERERVYELLSSIQTELDYKSRDRDDRFTLDNHLLRSIMLGDESAIGDFNAISEQCKSFLAGDYFAICLAPGHPLEKDSCYCFEDVDGQMVLLVPETSLSEIKHDLLEGRCAGISSAKNGPAMLREAYIESLSARKYAFISDRIQDYEKLTSGESHPLVAAEHVVRTLGVGKVGEASGLVGQMLFYAQNNRVSPDEFLLFLEQTLEGLRNTFGHISFAMDELAALEDILSFERAYEYFIALCGWMDRLSSYIANDLENRNVRKVRMAVDFIDEYFRSQINMAVVCNHVGMNYTLFSNTFKQYTGSNFPDYIKKLRIKESKRLLADLSLTVRRAGEMAGFGSDKHFLKCFKQETGITPGEYRHNLQNSL